MLSEVNLPATVFAASTIWIIVGLLGSPALIIGLCLLYVSLPVWYFTGVIVITFLAIGVPSSVSLVIGIRTIHGDAKDTLGSGIVSVILGMMLIGMSPNPFCVAVSAFLLVAGILALVGREDYMALGIATKSMPPKADLNDAQKQRDPSVLFYKLGGVLLNSGKTLDALGQYEQGLEVEQKLTMTNPQDVQTLRHLSAAHMMVGVINRKLGRTQKAIDHYQTARDIRNKLTALDPTDVDVQRLLAESWSNLGDLLFDSGKTAEALEQYRQGLEIRQKLLASAPQNDQVQFDFFVSIHAIARVEQEQQRYEQAIETYDRALQILQRLKEQDRLTLENEKWIGAAQDSIQRCRNIPAAMSDWKSLLEQPVEKLPTLLELRAFEFIKRDRLSEAVQAAMKLQEHPNVTNGQLYNVARVFGRCAAAIKPAVGQELSQEQAQQRQRHIQDALATLKHALATGWDDFEHMNDDDLKPLRDLPEFEALFPKKL